MGSGPRSDPRAGLTLLELLVVLTVIGMMAAVVGPNLGALVDSMTREDPPERLAGLLRSVRHDAVRSGTTSCFELRGSDGRYRVDEARSTDDGSQVRGRLEGWVGLPRKLTSVCFRPDGTARPMRWIWHGARDSAAVIVDAWDGEIEIVR